MSEPKRPQPRDVSAAITISLSTGWSQFARMAASMLRTGMGQVSQAAAADMADAISALVESYRTAQLPADRAEAERDELRIALGRIVEMAEAAWCGDE